MASTTAPLLDLRAILPLKTVMKLLLIYNHTAIQAVQGYQTDIKQSLNLITVRLLSANMLWHRILVSFCMIPYIKLDSNHKANLEVCHI